MPWGAAVGAVVGAGANKLLNSGGGSGGGSSSSSSEPWAAAAPWMGRNVIQGQALQDMYTAKPFNDEQLAAIDNQYAQGDYMRSLIPSLLGQLGGQQVGFDRSNVNAKPKAWDWTGLLGDGAPNLGQRSVLNAAPPASDSSGEKKAGDFRQLTDQNDVSFENLMNLSGVNYNLNLPGGATHLGGGAGFGDFQYGQDVKPGTQAYRDMQEYLAWGGRDPSGLYSNGSLGPTTAANRVRDTMRAGQNQT